MTVLSDVQIANYARSAGLSGEAVAVAVAVALAESGGNPNAHNPIPPDNSYGLWQINMIGSLGPARRSMLGIASNDALYDPGVNARAMAILSNHGANWHPWTTYTTGRYLFYLSRGRAAATGAGGGTSGTQTVGLGSDLSAIGRFFQMLTDPGTWKRVGLAVVGGWLIVMAILRSQEKTIGDVVKIAGKVA
jgi:hypothetical protein